MQSSHFSQATTQDKIKPVGMSLQFSTSHVRLVMAYLPFRVPPSSPSARRSASTAFSLVQGPRLWHRVGGLQYWKRSGPSLLGTLCCVTPSFLSDSASSNSNLATKSWPSTITRGVPYNDGICRVPMFKRAVRWLIFLSQQRPKHTRQTQGECKAFYEPCLALLGVVEPPVQVQHVHHRAVLQSPRPLLDVVDDHINTHHQAAAAC